MNFDPPHTPQSGASSGRNNRNETFDFNQLFPRKTRKRLFSSNTVDNNNNVNSNVTNNTENHHDKDKENSQDLVNFIPHSKLNQDAKSPEKNTQHNTTDNNGQHNASLFSIFSPYKQMPQIAFDFGLFSPQKNSVTTVPTRRRTTSIGTVDFTAFNQTISNNNNINNKNNSSNDGNNTTNNHSNSTNGHDDEKASNKLLKMQFLGNEFDIKLHAPVSYDNENSVDPVAAQLRKFLDTNENNQDTNHSELYETASLAEDDISEANTENAEEITTIRHNQDLEHNVQTNQHNNQSSSLTKGFSDVANILNNFFEELPQSSNSDNHEQFSQEIMRPNHNIAAVIPSIELLPFVNHIEPINNASLRFSTFHNSSNNNPNITNNNNNNNNVNYSIPLPVSTHTPSILPPNFHSRLVEQISQQMYYLMLNYSFHSSKPCSNTNNSKKKRQILSTRNGLSQIEQLMNQLLTNCNSFFTENNLEQQVNSWKTKEFQHAIENRDKAIREQEQNLIQLDHAKIKLKKRKPSQKLQTFLTKIRRLNNKSDDSDNNTNNNNNNTSDNKDDEKESGEINNNQFTIIERNESDSENEDETQNNEEENQTNDNNSNIPNNNNNNNNTNDISDNNNNPNIEPDIVYGSHAFPSFHRVFGHQSRGFNVNVAFTETEIILLAKGLIHYQYDNVSIDTLPYAYLTPSINIIECIQERFLSGKTIQQIEKELTRGGTNLYSAIKEELKLINVKNSKTIIIHKKQKLSKVEQKLLLKGLEEFETSKHRYKEVQKKYLPQYTVKQLSNAARVYGTRATKQNHQNNSNT